MPDARPDSGHPVPAEPRSALRTLIGSDALALLLLALAAFRVSLWLMPVGAATTPDSLNYLNAASGLAQGYGLSVPSEALDGPARLPLILWAPLYPMVLAAFLRLAAPEVLAASLLNGVLLALYAGLSQRLLRRSLGTLPATLGAAVITLLPTTLLVYSYAWSETLCLPLMLACLYAVERFGDTASAPDGRSGARWLGLASLACALMVYTRYACVAFIPLVALSAGLLGTGVAWGRRLFRTASSALLSGLLSAPLLLRNLLSVGHLSGGDRGGPASSLGDYCQALWRSLSHYLLRDAPLPVTLLIAACLALAAWRGGGRGTPPASAAPGRDPAIWLPAFWGGGYLLAIIVMSRLQHIDGDARMLSLAVPFAPLCLVAVCARLQASGAAYRAWLPCLAGFAFLAWNGGDTLRSANANWSAHGSPRFVPTDTSGPPYNNFTRNPDTIPWFQVRQLLDAEGAHGAVVIDDGPGVFRFLTGTRTYLSPALFDARRVAQVNAAGGPEGALVVTRPATLEALHAAYGPNLDGLRVLASGASAGVVAIALPLPPLPPDARRPPGSGAPDPAPGARVPAGPGLAPPTRPKV